MTKVAKNIVEVSEVETAETVIVNQEIAPELVEQVLNEEQEIQEEQIALEEQEIDPMAFFDDFEETTKKLELTGAKSKSARTASVLVPITNKFGLYLGDVIKTEVGTKNERNWCVAGFSNKSITLDLTKGKHPAPDDARTGKARESIGLHLGRFEQLPTAFQHKQTGIVFNPATDKAPALFLFLDERKASFKMIEPMQETANFTPSILRLAEQNANEAKELEEQAEVIE